VPDVVRHVVELPGVGHDHVEALGHDMIGELPRQVGEPVSLAGHDPGIDIPVQALSEEGSGTGSEGAQQSAAGVHPGAIDAVTRAAGENEDGRAAPLDPVRQPQLMAGMGDGQADVGRRREPVGR
jgi:hypothetical protein